MIDFFIKIKILFKYFFYYVDYKNWKKDILDKDLDSYVCCCGDYCGCGGLTIRENYK